MASLLPPYPGYQYTRTRCSTNESVFRGGTFQPVTGGADPAFIAQMVFTSLSLLLPCSDKPLYVNFGIG